MARKKNKKESCWKDIEVIIDHYEKRQFIDLLGDLYRLSSDNQNFFHTRFSMGEDPLAPYKRIIQNAIHPDLEDNETLDLESAQNAISRYSKAVDNPKGEAELRIFYVECGNNFTLDYGDIDSDFYDDLLEMYEYAIETVLELPIKEQKDFRQRLQEVMKSASGIGWGYHSGLCDLYQKSFPNEES